MGKQKDDAPKISPEDKKRIERSSRQLAAYTNFLRWAANFPKEEVQRHAASHQVMLLSPVQSGRFAFAIEGKTLLLGVQPFEAAWFANMPIEAAYISDRLYLEIDGVSCMSSQLLPLSLGIFVESEAKRRMMQAAEYVQPVRIWVKDGAVSEVGRALGLGFPIRRGDIAKTLLEAKKAKMQQRDIGRYF